MESNNQTIEKLEQDIKDSVEQLARLKENELNKYVTEFEKGKWYKCLLTERGEKWNSAGEMDDLLDGEPRQWLSSNSSTGKFSDMEESWYYSLPINKFVEVSAKVIPERTYKVGDRFFDVDEKEYILAETSWSTKDYINLVDLDTGHTKDFDDLKVKDMDCIKESEIKDYFDRNDILLER